MAVLKRLLKQRAKHILDTTRVEEPGRTGSERLVGESLTRIMSKNRGEWFQGLEDLRGAEWMSHLVRRYLEGFGPASAMDIAQFGMVQRPRARSAPRQGERMPRNERHPRRKPGSQT